MTTTPTATAETAIGHGPVSTAAASAVGSWVRRLIALIRRSQHYGSSSGCDAVVRKPIEALRHGSTTAGRTLLLTNGLGSSRAASDATRSPRQRRTLQTLNSLLCPVCVSRHVLCCLLNAQAECA